MLTSAKENKSASVSADGTQNSLPVANTPTLCATLLMTQIDYTKLIELLDKAENLASEFRGGYSGQFLSAEEFHQALFDSINKLKQGDNTQLDTLHIWFLPTSCWDDFIGRDGQDLANEISNLLLTFTKHNET